MTVDQEQAAIARLSTTNSLDDIRSVMRNSRTKAPAVYRAAFERLIVVSAGEQDSALARACWKMVHTIEQLRRESGRKVWRMNRLRPKIEREGERAAIAYCARTRTDGFQEVLDYGLPEYTAEAIVLGYPVDFPDVELQQIARQRLVAAGQNPERFIGRALI